MRPAILAALAALAAPLMALGACEKVEPAAHKVVKALAAIPRPARVAPGLVALDCDGSGPLRPAMRGYCVRQAHYVTGSARAALEEAAAALDRQFPGAQVRFMDASWPRGTVPMPPHHSHGDGRQIDLALQWTDLQDKPLQRLPHLSGYRAYEPPRREAERACIGQRSFLNDAPDPPKHRTWKLDEARTRELIRLLAADRRVRRVFVEPHLKARLGFTNNAKVRFAGCGAARHDDHLHVDFYS